MNNSIIKKNYDKKQRLSFCCNASIYYAPAYYNTIMLNNDGTPIKHVPICSKCGKEINKFLMK